MIEVGYSITLAGKTALHVAVDQALGKHGVRLGKTWLYICAFQNLAAKERLPFRKLMKEMCDAQGDHCLHTVAPAPPISRVVDLQIRKIARQHWRACIGWSGFIVSASLACGLLERYFPARVDGSPMRCAA